MSRRLFDVIARIVDALAWARQDLREHLCFMFGHDYPNGMAATLTAWCRGCGGPHTAAAEKAMFDAITRTPIYDWLQRESIRDLQAWGRSDKLITHLLRPSYPREAHGDRVAIRVPLRYCADLAFTQSDLDSAYAEIGRRNAALLAARIDQEIEARIYTATQHVAEFGAALQRPIGVVTDGC
jgi:hypothetical protein